MFAYDPGIREDAQAGAEASALGIEAVAFEKVQAHCGDDVLNRLLRRRGNADVVSVDAGGHCHERAVVKLMTPLPRHLPPGMVAIFA